MSDSQNNSEQNRKKVGVYDRPAGADRARKLKVLALVFAAVASVASVYFFFSG